MCKHGDFLTPVSVQIKVLTLKGQQLHVQRMLAFYHILLHIRSLKFTPTTQVVLHALEVRVQTSVIQQELSKLFFFSNPFGFWWWKFSGDKV